MNIIIARPPNYEQIIAVFPQVADMHGVYFCYGESIYNPDDVHIQKHIIAHERVHCQRQLAILPGDLHDDEGRIKVWWDRYLIDPKFRFDEELLAHKREYQAFCGVSKNHKLRELVLQQCAERLSSELYGNLISKTAARKAIRG